MYMIGRLLVVIASPDRDVIRTALMYAVNSKKRGWMDEVETIFFGPSEKTIAKDLGLQKLLNELSKDGFKALACKRVAEELNVVDPLLEIGLNVLYVGKYISDKVKDGFKVMVW